jgi:hypothetical protein
MPSNKKTTAAEQLSELERITKKVIRKSLKNNTLDYTVQITMSSLEPGKIKYACQITSPAQGVQPITFIFDSYELLEASLREAENELNPRKVEITFHQNRVNTLRSKADQHEARAKQLEDPEYVDEEEVPMEAVS